jgi:menaquinone-dependent protoporphyrinogen oxidase
VNGWELEVTMSNGATSEILIVYATRHGQTRAIADALAKRFCEHGHRVDAIDVRAAHVPPPEDYDLVVLGSHIAMGVHDPAIASYVRCHRTALAAMPTAFVSVSMAATKPSPDGDPSGYLATFFESVGWRPTRSVALAGALKYRDYGWLLRFMMKRISRSAGHTTDTSKNHDFTDWNRVRAFADELAGLVARDQPVRHV